jgi:hypothetical protein
MTHVRYASGAAALDCALIAVWNRGDLDPITGSSGLKDYFHNQVWSVFDSAPHIERVAMLHAAGPTFAVFRAGATWYDVTGERVILEPAL